MSLLHESSILGLSVKVYSDRVEYKRGLGNGVETIPIGQIASVKLGNWLVNQLWIETSGGREYAITTRHKKAVAEAIQLARTSSPAEAARHLLSPANLSVADELGKLANLRAQGILSNDEFERQKAAVLGSAPTADTSSASAILPAPSSPRTLLGKIRIVLLGVGALFVVLVVIGAAVGPSKREHRRAPPQSAPPQENQPTEKDVLNADEKGYFGPTIDYLNAINGADMRLSRVMAGAQDGTSNLEDIKDAIETARASEESEFRGYARASVPPSLRELDQEIHLCKRKHDAAFAEMLGFWSDKNTAHVERGTDELKQAVSVTNDCIAHTGEAMTRISNERRNAALAPTPASAITPPRAKRSRPTAK